MADETLVKSTIVAAQQVIAYATDLEKQLKQANITIAKLTSSSATTPNIELVKVAAADSQLRYTKVVIDALRSHKIIDDSTAGVIKQAAENTDNPINVVIQCFEQMFKQAAQQQSAGYIGSSIDGSLEPEKIVSSAVIAENLKNKRKQHLNNYR